MPASETLLISVDPCDVRSAVLRDGRLVEYAIEHSGGESLVGNIYRGRVARVASGIDAAFVECGLARDGFLPGADAPPGDDPLDRRIHEGQALTVQVVRDAVDDKGPRLTTRVTLPGRLLVLSLGGEGVSVSRRISDPAERRRLAKGLEDRIGDLDVGVIVRTVAEGCDLDDLALDLDALVESAGAIDSATESAPALLRAELGPVERLLRDRLGREPDAVIIDDPDTLAHGTAYARDTMPALAERFELHRDPEPLFRAYDIEGDIAGLIERHVALASGGALVIDATEALTVIDVDSAGRGARTGRAGDAALATNLEAADEIARQLRLRNIGGLIAIDFIGLAKSDDKARTVEALSAAVKGDPMPVRVSEMSEFGVVQLTRKQQRPGVLDSLTEPCPTCGGGGRLKSPRTVAAELVRETLSEARSRPGRPVSIIASPPVAAELRDEGAALLRTVERAVGAKVEIVSEAGRPRESYDVAVA
jgi:ribonuclease G